MLILMSDHVVWTRSYLKAVLNGTGDNVSAAERLMKNQEELGALFATYYGPEAGAKLTVLLKEHIRIAGDIIDDIAAGKSAKFQDLNVKWQENGYEIADYLASLNPNWDQKVMREMWDKHLSTTTAEVVARSQKDWGADVIAYDATYHHMLMFADILSDGIIKQFPDKFK